MNKWAIGIVVLVLVIAGVVYGVYEKHDYDYDDSVKSYTIINTWELPEELKEISGIQWIGDSKIACIQDEDGILFIYDLETATITEQYEFGGPGDYEAIATYNGKFWIAESNGRLYQIDNLDSVKKDSQNVQLDFEYRNNIEGLTASSDGKLWLAVKDRNLDNRGDYRGIYAYDPVKNILNKEPVLKINYNDPEFEVLRTHNPRKLIRPSDINFNPVTGDLYVLDAEFQKFLILDASGKIKALHLLDPEEFEQPEGICFSPDGRMFISNEALGGPANITELKIIK